MTDHVGDCGGTFCDYCGCCVHGQYEGGCKAAEAPAGMTCPEPYCGCEGDSYYDPPIEPRAKPDPNAQQHQETKLFDLGAFA